MMKPSLQLRMSQQLTMTPQLQQAIRLLQLSSLELQTEIEETLTTNPLLEVDRDGEGEVLEEKPEENTAPAIESKWEDAYSHNSSGTDEGEEHDFEAFNSPKETLQSHLLWQLNVTRFSERDKMIAQAIVEAINDEGYLSCSLQDIQETCHELMPEENEMEAVLHRIQRFDPVGVGARDLKECLLIQLDQHYENHPLRGHAEALVREDLSLLAKREYIQLKRKLNVDVETLKAIIKLIQSCHPKPGDLIVVQTAPWVIPDLRASKQCGKWIVELNSDVSPKLRINPNYAVLIRRADASADNAILRNYLQEARWFIKSLQSRNETLLKVAHEIVEFQQAFLEHGEEAMRPLVLHDIANAVEMHESTVSRITTQKYLHTPRGIYELKYFFSSHVNMQGGGECSSTAIRALIKKIVAHENPKKPLSDQKIAQFLKEQGINVARRTVAKYREALSILASNERKTLSSDIFL